MDMNLGRRSLLRSCGAGAAMVFAAACTAPIRQATHQGEPEAVTLEESNVQLADVLDQHFTTLWELARNPGKQWKVSIPTSTGPDVLTFVFQEKGNVPYRHVRLSRQSNGQAVDLLWGWKGSLPSVRLVDPAGNLVADIGFKDVVRESSDTGKLKPRDFLDIGVKAVAVGLAVWLGASVARVVLGAIAFLAFGTMVLGLLVIGVGILAPIASQLLEETEAYICF